MDERQFLAGKFEAHRAHLRGVAYRMLGSLSEAEDAVQESWLHVSKAGADGVENVAGWMTTIVARVCLDMLRSRKARREDPLGEKAPPEPSADQAIDPEKEALLADSIGVALLVILDTLQPAERLAFVLHDMFAVSFEEIAKVVGRSPDAARQLASRARRRVQGAPKPDSVGEQREIVSAFLAAVRGADFEALVAVLDPDVMVRAENGKGATNEVRGARTWAKGAIAFSRGIRFAQPALVDGAVGLVVMLRGRLFRAMKFGFANGKIAAVEVVAEPEHLARLDLALLDE
jgi:RNA polymerase sigma-70 factor (ECF subfamily)